MYNTSAATLINKRDAGEEQDIEKITSLPGYESPESACKESQMTHAAGWMVSILPEPS